MDQKKEIITEEDCYKILESSSLKDVHLLEYSVEKANDQIVGFLGDYFQLRLSFKCGNQVKEEMYFLKMEPISNENQRSFVRDCGIFEKEAYLYKNILPELIRFVKFDFAPGCLLVKNNVLVLEDLKRRNFNIVNRDYTLEECKSLLTTLAYFHSSSIIYEENKIKSGETFTLEEHMEKIPEGTFSFEEGNSKYKWLKCVTSCLVDFMKTLPAYDENLERKLRKIIFGGDLNEFIKPSERFRNVFTHNDLWSNNIFLHKNGKCSFVDFQLVRYTPPAYDLIMALFLNNSTEFLEDNLKSLLVFYYNTFSDILRGHKLNPEVILPINEFLESVKIYKIPALIEASMFAITVYLPEEKCVHIRGDSERYQNYTFLNKTPYIMNTFLNDMKYRKKILGLLITLTGEMRKKRYS